MSRQARAGADGARARSWWRRTARFVGLVAGSTLLVTGTTTTFVYLGYAAMEPVTETALAADAPDLDAASTAPASETTVILAGDGSIIGTFRPEELHVPLQPSDVPATVSAALVASEDRSFWEHTGVDVPALARALFANASAGGITQGGSTITQQLAKNLFTDGQRTFARKFDELRLALAIEREYSKEEILAAYLNTTYFGEGAAGAGAAARTYFRKPLQEVTLSEAALLVGIIPSPTRWNPRRSPEMAEARRLLVLDRLASSGLVTAAEVGAARDAPPIVHPGNDAAARYPFFVDYVRRWLIQVAQFEPDTVYSGGLLVETTLDPRMQDAAIAAVRQALPHPHDPEGAAVVLDPVGGQVRALVGGRDWERSKVNLALGALGNSVGRQPGSAFKPFVLATALEAGWSPLDLVDAPAEYVPAGADKPVGNYGEGGYPPMTLEEATWRSVNTTYVALAEEVGPDAVARLGRRLGLDLQDTTGVGASIGIGTYEVSPLGMAQAYAAFVRDGRSVPARPVQRVLHGTTGEVLLDLTGPVAGEQVLAADTARLVTRTLEGVVRRGTGTRARLDRPVAGKTGTTDDHTNAWFVGYTPQLVTSVWVGFPEANIPLRDIQGTRLVTGGTIPARIWRDIMGAALAGSNVLPFPPAPDRPPRALPPLPLLPPPYPPPAATEAPAAPPAPVGV